MKRTRGQRENEARRLIHEERLRQDRKWGTDQQNTDLEWLAILVEEVGELSQEILRDHFGGEDNKPDKRARILEELVQVGAVAKAWVEMRV